MGVCVSGGWGGGIHNERDTQKLMFNRYVAINIACKILSRKVSGSSVLLF